MTIDEVLTWAERMRSVCETGKRKNTSYLMLHKNFYGENRNKRRKIKMMRKSIETLMNSVNCFLYTRNLRMTPSIDQGITEIADRDFGSKQFPVRKKQIQNFAGFAVDTI